MTMTYTREQIAERVARVRDLLDPMVSRFFIFVNMGAVPEWSGKRNGIDRYVYPAISIHAHGVDVTARSEDELAVEAGDPSITIVRERL